MLRSTNRRITAAAITMVAVCSAGVQAATYTTPRQLALYDVYRLNQDGYTGDENTTQPKTDLNDGLNGDNPYYQRTNVARAHNSGSCIYWYTSAYQEAGEPDPAGPQYVDYVPPFGSGANQLTPGRYRLNAQWRFSESRASYPAEYIVNHAGGQTTILWQQNQGTMCETFDIGEFDMTVGSFIRVNDTGSESITFNRMLFTYLGPAGGIPYVNAGLDQTMVLPAAANLDGTAVDADGQPNPLAVTWSMTSGPGSVTFGDVNAVDTTATFSVDGTYVLRLTADDGLNAPFDEVTVTALPVGSCQLEVAPGCGTDRQPAATTYYRTYCRQYPSMTLAPASFTLTNQGSSQITYSVQTVTSATNLTPVAVPWLSIDNTGGTLDGSGSTTVTASFIISQMPMPADDNNNKSNTAFLAFSEGVCGLPTITRKINVQVLGANLTSVHEYLGDKDPLSADAAGPEGSGYNFVLADSSASQGAVENDLDAVDGKAWRIVDTGSAKTKYRAARLNPLPDPEIYTRSGATIVARMRVRNYVYTDPWGFGLLMFWDNHLTADLFWGGPDGKLMETDRQLRQGETLTGDDKYHTFRMTAIGDGDCNRIIKVYVDEQQNPAAVLTIPDAAAIDSDADGLGFGAGNTAGTVDVAFDWVTMTNTGAFAPGEENAVLGRSLLVGRNCGTPWVDTDGDGDVDQEDFSKFQVCYTGMDGVMMEGCECFDNVNPRALITELDLDYFEACASGPGVQWQPSVDCPN